MLFAHASGRVRQCNLCFLHSSEWAEFWLMTFLTYGITGTFSASVTNVSPDLPEATQFQMISWEDTLPRVLLLSSLCLITDLAERSRIIQITCDSAQHLLVTFSRRVYLRSATHRKVDFTGVLCAIPRRLCRQRLRHHGNICRPNSYAKYI